MGNVRLQEPPFALPYETIIHGRYLVQEVIGAGGFGITYRGIDLSGSSQVAIKEYYPNGNATRAPGTVLVNVHSQESAFRKGMDKFLQEARIIYHYHNPNILRIFSLFEENNTAYYVMEYLTGRDLKAIIKDSGGRLPWNRLKGIILPVMDALHVIHSDGVIHRDISPDNIYVCDDGTPRLIDFGNARSYSVSREFTVILKKNFAPPEQYISNGRQGPWTDVYAMAATIYRGLTGILPPEAPERQRHDSIIWPDDAGSDAPRTVNNAVMRGLALGEFDRYATMKEFRNDLEPENDAGLTASMGNVITDIAGRFRFKDISFKTGTKRLVCCSGVYFGQTINIDGDIVFGRDNSCNILFPKTSAGVSRIHCQIIKDRFPGRINIVDCGSTYGTFVNGIRLTAGQPCSLKNGDMISFGQDNSFRYETH
ncbi:MAG: protein kinase [Lachnospiraceae bacterium]|nr:protein kinase [Lachnospiraceae bacterium]